MLFEKKLIPDMIFPDIYSITPEFLAEQGITALISDIDNTLVTYDDAAPTEQLMDWIDSLRKAGIQISFISNNNKKRVSIFNRNLGFFARWASGKPGTRRLYEAMKHMGSNKENTAVLGDQLLTDALAGKIAGLRTYIVPPIKDRTDLFNKLKRAIERPYIKRYEELHAKKV